ncbi:MAG: hypothetical protein ACRER8_02595 [Pseudomonas sp.]|uniref:hypothetical protein n=1 Tax=Pseudomonas sp. TaxID=306 RepID=UPI003D6EE057
MLKMVNDDETPGQSPGARRILYALTADETPDMAPSIKGWPISFPEKVYTMLRIVGQTL